MKNKPNLKWKDMMNKRLLSEGKDSSKVCDMAFGKWEANAKREKAAWLKKREIESNKKKRAAEARKSFTKSGEQ